MQFCLGVWNNVLYIFSAEGFFLPDLSYRYVVLILLFFISIWFKQISIEEKNGNNYLSAGEVRFQEHFLSVVNLL